ncbi:hypothetical protein GCM10010129_83240 [Streptomyces fumigatiscleroticus]|nr:hypothetical protein GCM10010129_83240 [Streptomyces fumigatiscleroticus]
MTLFVQHPSADVAVKNCRQDPKEAPLEPNPAGPHGYLSRPGATTYFTDGHTVSASTNGMKNSVTITVAGVQLRISALYSLPQLRIQDLRIFHSTEKLSNEFTVEI